MGYSTYFSGSIKITPELKAGQIAFINEILENDYGDLPSGNFRADFQLTKNMRGLEHNGGEKSYEQDEAMQELIALVVAEYPELKFNGTMKATGEEYDDRWKLVVKDNVVEKEEQVITGPEVICPHCEEKFKLNEEEQESLK